MPCCSRCEAEVIKYDDDAPSELRLQEVNMSFGIITVFCFECRSAWAAFSYNHDLFQKYGKANFRLNAWKHKQRKDPFKVDLAEGEKLFDDLEGLETKLHQLAANWIKAGLSREEKNKRKN